MTMLQKYALITAIALYISSPMAVANDRELTHEQQNAVRNLIISYGYNCDNINPQFPPRISPWDGDISVNCFSNRGKWYSYEIEDVGGTWIVKPD